MNNQETLNYTRTLWTFLNEFRSEKNPIVMAEHILKIKSLEKTLHRFYEIACERELSLKELQRQEGVEGKIELLAAGIGFSVRFNSDPRGLPVKFTLPSGKHNSWDGETWVLDF